MKYLIAFLLIGAYPKLSAQNVGIGTTTPNSAALLHVDLGSSTTKGFLVTGTENVSSSIPNLGAGTRMMFFPGKAAFRSGYVDGTQWNNSSVGFYSFGIGYNTIASGNYSFATGFECTASNDLATAIGYQNTASAPYSTTIGRNNDASGYGSTAIGAATTASGMGAIAMGNNTYATGDFSTAMGYEVNTNNQKGSFVIGDSDPNSQGFAMPGLPDLFVARFNNGYYLQTSGYTSNIGVQVGHNGNAWVSVCDVNLKENFEPLNGEDVLQKLSKINFSSWNYKKQDPKIYRHYGIMAQDFYKAFGHDNFGTIGNDTTVNPIDMIGIDMTAIQALEKRTATLQDEVNQLKEQNAILVEQLTELKEKMKK